MEIKKDDLEAKYGQFRNTIWCMPDKFEIVSKHVELFTSYFKDNLISPVVREDIHAPVDAILVVTNDLQLKVIKIR